MYLVESVEHIRLVKPKSPSSKPYSKSCKPT